MVYEFKFPDVGEGITEGEIINWKVKEGDFVKEDQPLGEIETDKAVVEMPSPRTGKIITINKKPGETVHVGETLVTIEEKTSAKEVVKESKTVVGEVEEAKEGVTLASPQVRELAKKFSVDISKVQGTGAFGMITEEDVKRVTKAPKAEEKKLVIKAKYDLYGYVDRIPLKGVRRAIAKRMTDANAVPQAVGMDEIDFTELSKIREEEKKKAEKKKIKLTYLPYILKALVSAMKKHPIINSSLEGEEIIVKKYYNFGVAVDTEEGLMVPVIKGIDQKDLYSLAKEIQALAEKARNRTIDLGDMRGGTFTITNVGSIGGTYGIPLVNYPETAILMTGRMIEKPVVINGEVKIRKMMPISVSFDHRVTDGAEVARFLNDLKELLENPKQLLKKV